MIIGEGKGRYIPIYLGLTGSRLYGTNRPDSDWDYRGVVLGTEETYLGMLESFENTNNLDLIAPISPTPEFDWSGLENQDNDFYEVGKFIRLAWDANPNIIELLFCPSLLTDSTGSWIEIMEHRRLFISLKCLHTFSGYAASQLKRMKNHHRWVKGITQPDRAAMGLPITNKVLNAELLKHLNGVSNTDLEFLFPQEEQRLMIKQELEYQRLKREWKSYKKWQRERNPARAALEEKYGYDTKHCMHLYRLFYECKRLLEQGELVFPLPEAEDLKAILYGAQTYDQVLTFGESIDAQLQKVAETSSLPHDPDRKTLDKLIQRLRKKVIL